MKGFTDDTIDHKVNPTKAEFRRAYDLKAYKESIYSLLLALVVIIISGPLDYFGFPLSGSKMLVIVYGFEVPIVLLAWYLIRTPKLYEKHSKWMAYFGLTATLGIIYCLAIIRPEEPMFQGFVNGAVGTAIVWIFASNKIRPMNALIASIVLDVSFNVVWFYRGFEDQAILAGSNFAMFAFILFGFWGTRFAERLLYEDYVKSKIIEAEKEEINLVNTQLKKSLEVNNMLTSLISHDVRSPLNSLRGVLNLYTVGAITDSEFRRCATGITSTIDLTGELLNNLLLWSSTQKSGFSPMKKKLQLHLVVEKVFTLLKPLFGSKIKLVNNVPNEVIVFADESMISTVLRNLISNSIKYTSNGSITVSTNVSRFITEVVVQDTGLGINANSARNIFTWRGPSESGDSSISTFDNGFGFGLFISKEFIEHHDGILTYINSETEEGGNKGTIFYFTLPNFEMLGMPFEEMSSSAVHYRTQEPPHNPRKNYQ